MSSVPLSTASTALVDGLQRLLYSTDAVTFLRKQFGQQMLYVPGPSERWTDLLSWNDLNSALNEGFVLYPRIRLVQLGTDVDPALYTYSRSGQQWPDSHRCQRLMAEGATLILMNIESINPRLDSFVRQLERDLGADVRVDAVATCASVPGLKMHWDNAECFNIQLAGQKHWRVVRPDRPYPLTATPVFPQRKDAVAKPVAPECPPTWEGVLTPGDLIYLPRGWWHAVTPHVTPSLHLSFGVDVPTMSDALRWYAEDVTRHEVARRPLPLWQSPADRRQWIDEAIASMPALSPDIVEAYLAHLSGSTQPRASFALPETLSDLAMLKPTTLLRLRSTKPIRWTTSEEFLTFEWNGQTYRFSLQTLPALRKLATMQAFTFEDLHEGAERLVVRSFVLALTVAGLLTITTPGSSAP